MRQGTTALTRRPHASHFTSTYAPHLASTLDLAALPNLGRPTAAQQCDQRCGMSDVYECTGRRHCRLVGEAPRDTPPAGQPPLPPPDRHILVLQPADLPLHQPRPLPAVQPPRPCVPCRQGVEEQAVEAPAVRPDPPSTTAPNASRRAWLASSP